MTIRRAALAVALAATLVYLPALANRYALDDSSIIENNPAAQSIAGAVRAFGQSYWPPEHEAGLWRPLVILSFAADYQVSGGSTVVLHATNIVLHAAVSAAVVAVLAPYVSVAGALAGGLVFAVHPVHVEAVANLVGRAELLAALFLLLAVLASRSARARRAAGRSSAGAEALMMTAVLLGLLSKEHAVIAVALIWLDETALAARPRLPARDYLALIALSAAWFLVRRAAEGGVGFTSIAPTFFGLDTAGRLSTMLPVVFVVVRLFVWPWDLSPDYHPEVVARLTAPTALGVAGGILLLACGLLALALWRTRRAPALGLLIIGMAWLPTANLLFPTGIVLAERTLYFPSVGLALLAAALFDGAVSRGWGGRTAMLAAPGLLLALFAARTLTRIPDWRSTRALVVSALLAHPESYKVHQSAARVLVRLGRREAAQREYRLALELFDGDPYLSAEAAVNALELGDLAQARRLARRSEALDTRHAVSQQVLARLLLMQDSAAAALGHARRAVALAPRGAEAARMLIASWLALGRPDSAHAAWAALGTRGGRPFDVWLLSAATHWATGRAAEAAAALDSAAATVPDDTVSQRRLTDARREFSAAPTPRH